MFKTRGGRHRLARRRCSTKPIERAGARARAQRAGPRRRPRAVRLLRRRSASARVKYADLANDRIKDYVFDWDRMLAAEGRTGPYLQYAHARIHSIFRKAAGNGRRGAASAVAPSSARRAGRARARARAARLRRGGARVAADSLQPHRLAGYLYDLATAFTAFFESCPVLRRPTTRRARRGCALRAYRERARARPRPARHRGAGAHVARARRVISGARAPAPCPVRMA